MKKSIKHYSQYPMIFSSLDHHQITNQTKIKRQVITREEKMMMVQCTIDTHIPPIYRRVIVQRQENFYRSKK